MCIQESVSQGVRQPKEWEEFLREDVALPDVKPRLAAHFLLVVAGQRQVTKVAVRDQAQLVVVIEDDPAGAGHPEVLEQQISGKSVGGRQVPNALAVVNDRRSRAVVTCLPYEEVQRSHPALGIEVRDMHLVRGNAHVFAATREKF